MMLAMEFVTWPLLLGAVAAGIPLVLHMISNVRARQEVFPTLRFLRISMEKTARKRRVQNVLLLLLRSAMLAALAFAAAEPFTRIQGTPAVNPDHRKYAAVVIIDNSLSMSARNRPAGQVVGAPDPAGTRFAKALTDARKILANDAPPALAQVLFTNAPPIATETSASASAPAPTALTSDMPALLERLSSPPAVATVQADLGDAMARALAMLDKAPAGVERHIYILTDMQQAELDGLIRRPELERAKTVRLNFISAVEGPVQNVSVAELNVRGRGVVGEALKIEARLVNTGELPADVRAGLVVGDKRVAESAGLQRLEPAGREGDSTIVTFEYAPTQAGPIQGAVVLAVQDDLDADNERAFATTIRDRTEVMVVSGPAGRTDAPGLAPSAALRVALQPFLGAEGWPIVMRPAEGIDSAKFSADTLKTPDVAFFCDVPEFSAVQAQAIRQFVDRGGKAVFFLGPNVRIDAYNAMLAEPTGPARGLLPGRLAPAVGQIDLAADAEAATRMDVAYPLLAGLYRDPAEYPSLLVRRYYPFALAKGVAMDVPIRHQRTTADPAGDPLLIVRKLGAGKVVVFASSASPIWNRLAGSPLLLPLTYRLCLPEQSDLSLASAQPPARPIDLPPPAASDTQPARVSVSGTYSIELKTPGGQIAKRSAIGPPVRVFTQAPEFGPYVWSARDPAGRESAGVFIVNPDQNECRLTPMNDKALRDALAQRGASNTYVGAAVEPIRNSPPIQAQPERKRNWWDLALAGVILLLVFEAVVANRFRRKDVVSAMPIAAAPDPAAGSA